MNNYGAVALTEGNERSNGNNTGGYDGYDGYDAYDYSRESEKLNCYRRPQNDSHRRGRHHDEKCTTLWFRIVIGGTIAIFLVASSVSRFLLKRQQEAKNYRYDYIVVGGGPSGILAATKLARGLPAGRILLLESGTATQSAVRDHLQQLQQDKRTEQAGAGQSSASHAQLKQQLQQQQQQQQIHLNKFDIPLLWSGVARDGEHHHWPDTYLLLARALGGSGLVNAMIYVRSLPHDFQTWNTTGWTWENMMPHYMALENYQDDILEPPSFYSNATINTHRRQGQRQQQQPHRGRHGPVVTIPAGGKAVDSVAPLFVESLINAGIPLASRGFNDVENNNGRVGGGYYDFNIARGVRHSIAAAFLGEGMTIPPNLDIITGATVHKVVLDTSSTGKVTVIGVDYTLGGPLHRAILREEGSSEVLLACGAILTPQVLANSGISDGGAIVDLPGVGKNLHDHPVVGVAVELTPKLAEQASSVYTMASEMNNYFTTVQELENVPPNASLDEIRSMSEMLGPLSTAGFSAGAFLTSPWASTSQSGNQSIPDIQLTVFPRVLEPHIAVDKVTRQEIVNKCSNCMLVTVALLQPEARFHVTPSQVSNRFELPHLHLPPGVDRYLTDHDAQRIAWGVQEVRRILSYPPLSLQTAQEVYPGSHVVDDVLLEHIKSNHLPNSHWVGTAQMGTSPESGSVVDDQLKVYGVKHGLRIVDASVMPHIPNGNTHSTVCAIASRVAQLILESRRAVAERKRQEEDGKAPEEEESI